MDKIDFKGKVVIVTGASSGIGAETAKLLANHNASLTLVGRNDDRLTKVANECQTKNGQTPLCLLLDLTEEGSCEAVVKKTVEVYKKIDVLINCAGKIKIASLFDLSIEEFDDNVNINLRVPYLMSQLALPHLMKTKGNIVNVGSSLAKRHKPGFLAYFVAKSGLEEMTKQGAVELATEGVRMNIISPGVTRTNILEGLNMDEDSKTLAYTNLADYLPQRSVVEPKEVASLIILAASELFPHMNGSNIVVDGAGSMYI